MFGACFISPFRRFCCILFFFFVSPFRSRTRSMHVVAASHSHGRLRRIVVHVYLFLHKFFPFFILLVRL